MSNIAFIAIPSTIYAFWLIQQMIAFAAHLLFGIGTKKFGTPTHEI